MSKKQSLWLGVVSGLSLLTVGAPLVTSMVQAATVQQTTAQMIPAEQQLAHQNVLMLDVARRRMTKAQILQCIHVMNPHDFPWLQLHLTDNENYSVNSTWLHYRGQLSLQDLRQIVQAANRKGITVIPDIDVPSHDATLIRQLKRVHPQLVQRGVVMGPQTLDYTNALAVPVVEHLAQEVLPAFAHQRQRLWMIGADEVPGNVRCANELSHFLNQLDQWSQQRMHMHCIVWNDAINPQVMTQLRPDVMIDYWNARPTAQARAHVVKYVPYQSCYYNTLDLNDAWFRRYKLHAFDQQRGMLALWGSDRPQEHQISNQQVVSFIQQAQRSLHQRSTTTG